VNLALPKGAAHHGRPYLLDLAGTDGRSHHRDHHAENDRQDLLEALVQ
jgi:hypothetical protein